MPFVGVRRSTGPGRHMNTLALFLAAVDPKPLLRVKGRAYWRRWLRDHQGSTGGCWLLLVSADGRTLVEYNAAVEEALCYGWIDSTVRRLEDGSRAQRFTPRRANSPVSEMNRARVRRLVRQRRMTKAGLAALPDVDAWLEPPPLVVPKDIKEALQHGEAWEKFQAFPEAYRRIRVGWIEMARKRPEEFRKRLSHLVRMTRQGKRFGMVLE